MARTPVTYGPQPNGDEAGIMAPVRYIGNFHKTLPHDEFGQVIPAAFMEFSSICRQGGHSGNFERVQQGPLTAANQTTFVGSIPPAVAKLNNPQAGRAVDPSGPDPLHLEMQPAPGILSASTAAEMAELYWMASLRDATFDTWESAARADFDLAIADLDTMFRAAVADTADPGRLQPGADLPAHGELLDLRLNTLFRVGLPNEDLGPLVSQFFLQDFNYGAQRIDQTIVPYRSGQDYLTSHGDWLLAQNTGYDKFGHDYGGDNDRGEMPDPFETPPDRRHIASMRDLARFVNRDALHQAYFNAALQLLNWGVKSGPGNPYESYQRQGGFGTLGGPHLLALVSEVASRALKVVWRQKWLVHRRARPEVFGGLMQMQRGGLGGVTQNYGIPETAFGAAAERVKTATGTYFLPMAYTAGSPPHPSYGAGHACVAGACVTILKAWFRDQNLASTIDNQQPGRVPGPGKDPGDPPRILQPGAKGPTSPLGDYSGIDRSAMTVHGELNKIAANVAMGRSMGGVHWRSDNTRSLRLGERVATIMLRRLLPTLAERPVQLDYVNFDGDEVTINSNGTVAVPCDAELAEFYSRS